MRQHRKEQHRDAVHPITEKADSTAIQNLIEQLDRDLEEYGTQDF
jgi:DNA-binding cell septation regulator SpoVG